MIRYAIAAAGAIIGAALAMLGALWMLNSWAAWVMGS